jgi:hypothetical protein
MDLNSPERLVRINRQRALEFHSKPEFGSRRVILSNRQADTADKGVQFNRSNPTPSNQSPMTDVETIIAEAAKLPLRDAAFSLWPQRPRLDALERPPMTPEDIRIARALSLEEVSAKVRFSRDYAQDGATFDRLKRAHPQASDTEIRRAIIAAVRFDDACFKYFTVDSTDYWQRVVRAVALAQRHENPGYLEGTYEDARYHVAYYMK